MVDPAEKLTRIVVEFTTRTQFIVVVVSKSCVGDRYTIDVVERLAPDMVKV